MERAHGRFGAGAEVAVHRDGGQRFLIQGQAAEPELDEFDIQPGVPAPQRNPRPAAACLHPAQGFAFACELRKPLDADIDVG